MVLSEGHDAALRLVLSRRFPGWGYWLSLGATTCWESWTSMEHKVGHVCGEISADMDGCVEMKIFRLCIDCIKNIYVCMHLYAIYSLIVSKVYIYDALKYTQTYTRITTHSPREWTIITAVATTRGFAGDWPSGCTPPSGVYLLWPTVSPACALHQ